MTAGTIWFCIQYGAGIIIFSILTYYLLRKQFKKYGGVD